MTDKWLETLEKCGAHINGSQVDHFGNQESLKSALINQTPLITPLTHHHLIRASGADTTDFIHNQVCNDVRLVTSELSQVTAHCSHKGRMLFLFRLFMRGHDYYLRLPAGLATAALKRLSMFILRSQVMLTDVSNDLVGIGLIQPDEGLLEKSLGIAPLSPNQVATKGNLSIVALPGPTPRYEIYGPEEEMIALWQELIEHATPAGTPTWELFNIRAGLPTVLEQTQEAFVPQMANLQLVDGISFTKGCYPGQEVVARMQYRGELKRRMYLARVDTDQCPRPGDTLYAPGVKSGQWAGKVVDAQPSPNGGCELLAVLHIPSIEESDFHINDELGPKLELTPLPYSWEEENA